MYEISYQVTCFYIWKRQKQECNGKTVEAVLYPALLRPRAVYAVPFWSPDYSLERDSLENIKRRMTKLIPGIRNLQYKDKLRKLVLHSLRGAQSEGRVERGIRMENGSEYDQHDKY